MQEKDITSELLFKKINEIFTNERIYSSMKKNIKAMNKPNSLKIITDNILEYLHVD
jgi:UDP-N-acetylglucosamine:LPS N-acetylglucosamine transferase